jgi:hypothetical protein
MGERGCAGPGMLRCFVGKWVGGVKLGAVLKKIHILGFGGPGLEIHVLKENNCPAPVLEGEGRIYSICGVRSF